MREIQQSLITIIRLGRLLSIQKWKTEACTTQLNTRIFSVDEVERVHPDTGVSGQFVVVNSPSWVNIIPITTDNQVVLVEQYRHGTNEVTLELPGGMVEVGEDPAKAGERECLEETGYGATESCTLLGVSDPNPAWLNNKCYMYVWKNCELLQKQNLDPHEDIAVRLVPLSEIPGLIQNGTIAHSLVLSAFLFYFFDLSTFPPSFASAPTSNGVASHSKNE